MFDLTGRAAFIAGGAGYLATPACRALLTHGADIIIGDLNAERLRNTVAELTEEYPGSVVEAYHFDISDEESIKGAVARMQDRFGRFDILVNATAYSAGKIVEEVTGEEFNKSIQINVTGSFLLARASAQVMEHGGSIIMFSSMYGQISPNSSDYPEGVDKNPVDYGVAKAGLVQMVKYLAGHYGKKNIRVNSIAPGAFPWESTQDQHSDFMEKLSEKCMLGRIGRQDEIAGTVVYLSSDESSFMTGQVLCVDGGVTSW
jgi:NAD(P)-dependent dehydrogenase (short-subunit alcohol dehydrogenase family)